MTVDFSDVKTVFEQLEEKVKQSSQCFLLVVETKEKERKFLGKENTQTKNLVEEYKQSQLGTLFEINQRIKSSGKPMKEYDFFKNHKHNKDAPAYKHIEHCYLLLEKAIELNILMVFKKYDLSCDIRELQDQTLRFSAVNTLDPNNEFAHYLKLDILDQVQVQFQKLPRKFSNTKYEPLFIQWIIKDKNLEEINQFSIKLDPDNQP